MPHKFHLYLILYFQRPKPQKRTIAVLLPCRERGSRTTQQWLRRLQNYLATSHNKSSATRSVRIVTLFTCKARAVFATLDIPNLAGVLSFEPRKLSGGEGDEPPPLRQFKVSGVLSLAKVTEIQPAMMIRYKVHVMSSIQELVEIHNMYFTSSKQELVKYITDKASARALKLCAN